MGGIIGLCLLLAPDPAQPERWFAPGAVGMERGSDGGGQTADVGAPAAAGSPASAVRRPPSGSFRRPSSGFLTRGLSGVPAQWAERNAITSRLAFSHNLAGVFPPSLYDAHPEFFPLVDGQRLRPPPGSGFWNPDIAREDAARYAAETARKHFDAHPADESYPLGVNDALVWGESPELLALTDDRGQRAEDRSGNGGPKWFRERPDYSNLVFTFMNRAAAELAKTHPDKYLGALAYYWAENVPDFPLHPQVVPFLTADRSQGYDPAFKQEEFELQERWGRRRADDTGRRADGRGQRADNTEPRAEVLRPPSSDSPSQPSAVSRLPSTPPRRLGLYDYLYGGGFLIPRIHTKLLAENLRHARRVGFTDYYAEIYPNWGLDGPMPWLTAQLLQDPEQPLETLLDEYYARYFREAAVPMRQFFARCEELWMAQPGPPYWLKHYRNQSQAVVFPAAAVRELRGLLDAAQRDAWFDRTRARVQQVSAAFGVTERFLAFHDGRDRLKRLALGTAPEGAEVVAALNSYLEARRDFIRYTTELQRADPLAVRAFGWDDYLKDDPVPVALFAILRAEGSTAGPPLTGGPGDESGRFSGKAPATSAGPTLLDEPKVAALWKAISSAETAVPLLTQRATLTPGSPARERRDRDAAGEPGEQMRVRTEGRNAGLPASELLRNPGMKGAVNPARTMAGLPYGVALPAEWQSRVEPAQFHRAELVDEGTERAVRISGTKDTTVSQWAPLPARGIDDSGALQRAAITVRGRVSPGTAVHLVFSWLDAKERHLGFKMVRLPDGDWPQWVTLRQAGVPPAGATWVGLGLRVQNQVKGDWVEAKGFGATE